MTKTRTITADDGQTKVTVVIRMQTNGALTRGEKDLQLRALVRGVVPILERIPYADLGVERVRIR